ncbi:DUF4817 domain-containing protein [Trichonephila clavipes]|nr:DUF4817 domain-containing protein [Trichonephila clavipes]
MTFSKILFSDEAHFCLNGYVNKQNCRIWSEANPQVYVETPLHPEKLIVWCALWAGGISVPYFFKNDEGHNVTVNCNTSTTLTYNEAAVKPKLISQPDKIENAIEETADLVRQINLQINLEVDSDDIQELTIDNSIEMHEQEIKTLNNLNL